MGWRKKWRNFRERYLSGEASVCGYTSFISSPDRTTNSAWAFGLTQTQSTPGGTLTVPLVSIAISNLRLCNSSMSASSSWRRGSPPVHTTKRDPSIARGHDASKSSYQQSCAIRSGELTAALSVNANEIRVTELADRAGSIIFPARPKIASRVTHAIPQRARCGFLPLARYKKLP